MTPENWPLKRYLPATANLYCFQLWQKYQFNIRISAPRKTKLGDYRYRPGGRTHLITINNNLNPYAFLLVYLHEVAHCTTYLRYGQKVKPHGTHWQQELREITQPLLDEDVLPNDITVALLGYLKAPKAASCSSVILTMALRKYDPESPLVPLEQIPGGAIFSFRSKKYRKINQRRTRVACEDTHTNRTWLIPMLALVEPVES
jgi:hypothetical protein